MEDEKKKLNIYKIEDMPLEVISFKLDSLFGNCSKEEHERIVNKYPEYFPDDNKRRNT